VSTIESIKRKIEIAQELQSVVKTMKAIAAVSIKQYERAVESLVEYNQTIEMGLQVVLAARETLILAEPSKNNRLAAIVFGSDQGMCGQFNEQIASYAIAFLNNLSNQPQERKILAVGTRVIASLENAGQSVEEYFAMPKSIAGITPIVQELLLKIEEWRTHDQINQISLFYNQFLSNNSHHPHSLHLLPVDQEWLRNLQQQRWSSRSLPTFTMDWNKLFSSLIEQYFFISLYRVIAESLASENSHRLTSMQVAQKNIEESLEELTAQFQHQRQNSITEELLDIVAGFEALNETK
jgi:F-type H+-transporting ATPase subunit gamma